ncbi:oxidoreductase [Lojkania enalia]|uniref:Oxidoreductase n=1 Tax=Lojkania enalia TaxID=147567 RepID=A0A9P4N0N9_9PLEO|nr:oxidoreductase [Didymosphaeria enalia]
MPQKYVLITGCSAGGIGHALAHAFASHNLLVFATARNISKMSSLKDTPNIHLLELDVTSLPSIIAAEQAVRAKTGGKLDYLVNNAGVQHVMPLLDVDIDKAKEAYDTNIWGPLRMVQIFSDLLIEARGMVMNVGSVAGELYLPMQGIYNSSKAAMNLLSETMRLELAPLGIKVITLMTGNVKSHMSDPTACTSLPSTSRYLEIKDKLDTTGYSNMPTEKFAKQVVEDMLVGKDGKVWRGLNALTVRLLAHSLPVWIMDRLMLINGRGLADMSKAGPK